MKITHLLFALSLVSLLGCSTAKPQKSQPSRKAELSPETVIITYHVKPGMEAELRETLSQAWTIYQKEHLVFAQPHVIIRGNDGGDLTRFVEIFTWVSHAAPDHAPDSVKALWNRMQSLCEARDGRRGLEGGEVELLTPKLPGK